MKKLRVFLIPLGMFAEAIALVLCWSMVVIHRPTASRLVNWFADVLPDRDWYCGGWSLPITSPPEDL